MSESGARDVAALILAAGASSRMPGTTKLLRPWGDGVVVDAVVSAARRSDLGPIHVVVGAAGARLRRHLHDSDIVTVSHDEWRRGPPSSLGAGLAAVGRSEDTRAVVVLLGDEPGIREETIRATVSTWRASGAELLRARYRDRPGHPVLLVREAWAMAIEAVTTSDDSRSNWERLSSLGLETCEVPLDGLSPVDVDDPAALARARARTLRRESRQPGPERR